MWEQLKSGKLHTILCSWNNSRTVFLLAYLDNEAFGADKGEEACAYNGFKDGNDKECEDIEDDQAEEAGSVAGQ